MQLLDARFSTDKAKVDTNVFNASRILKHYGTKAIKGSSLAQRPHRYSSIDLSDIPDDVDLFGKLAAELEAFKAEAASPCGAPAAAGAGPKEEKQAASSITDGGWDFEVSSKVDARPVSEIGAAVPREPEAGRADVRVRGLPVARRRRRPP
jgi:hypothetical protein